MLSLYYGRPSLYSRPIWLTLLEKELDFELRSMQMNGDQFEVEFSKLNPFHRIPVLVDEEVTVFESAAIFDYLEQKYPKPALLPETPKTLAKVRMVQSIVTNELLPAAGGLIAYQQAEEKEYAGARIINVLNFFEQLLGENNYFAGDQISIAEIFAGVLIPDLPKVGVSLENYPKLNQWSQSLLQRNSWQAIQLTNEEWDNFKRRLGVMIKIWQKRRRQKMAVSQTKS